MSKNRGKKRGVVKYKPKSFSIDVQAIEQMDQHPEINYSNLVNRFLLEFGMKIEGKRYVNPNFIFNQMLSGTEES